MTTAPPASARTTTRATTRRSRSIPTATTSRRSSTTADAGPWRVAGTYLESCNCVYVDEAGGDEQRAALEAIFTGRLGGDALEHFPWAWKESNLLAVRPAAIELDHTPRRQWFRVRDVVEVRVRAPAAPGATVTCAIPGHDRDGEELVVDELRVADPLLEFEYRGVCAYGSTFEYAGGG